MWRNAASQMCRAEVKLEIKLQKELVSMGSEDYAGMPYTMRARGGYANSDFAEICGSEAMPIYASYLWYIGEMVNGKPGYKIFVGKAAWWGGKLVPSRLMGRSSRRRI